MNYNELTKDQLTLQELSEVSGGDNWRERRYPTEGSDCKKRLTEMVYRKGELWWVWDWDCPPGIKKPGK